MRRTLWQGMSQATGLAPTALPTARAPSATPAARASAVYVVGPAEPSSRSARQTLIWKLVPRTASRTADPEGLLGTASASSQIRRVNLLAAASSARSSAFGHALRS